MTTQITGTVSTYKADRGFGFCRRDDGQPDVFLHATQLLNADELTAGQRVTFEMDHDRDGRPRGKNIRVVG